MKQWQTAGLGMTILALGLAAMLAPPGAGAAEPSRPSTVRIGLVGTLFRDTPTALIEPMMRPFKSLMESQTGVTGQMVLAKDGEDLRKKLEGEQVHFGVFHGFEFAWARQKQAGLKPLVIAINQYPYLKAYVVVNRESDINGVVGLKGKSAALPRFSREHCHLFLDRCCLTCGSAPKDYFSALSKPQDAEAALDQVADGTIEAAIVDKLALEAYERSKPGWFGYLKVAQESEPFPATVVSYKDGTIDEETLQRFRDGLVKANQTRTGKTVLGMCRISAFEPVPADYLQTLDQILKVYPPK
jgi:ABC-type phosphate/phosphonate transport system substrate-binding protein